MEERVANALKPPKCPSCGAEVSALIFSGLEWVSATLTLDDYGNPQYTSWDSHDFAENESEYSCPKCYTKLFDNEEDAVKFLRGELSD